MTEWKKWKELKKFKPNIETKGKIFEVIIPDLHENAECEKHGYWIVLEDNYEGGDGSLCLFPMAKQFKENSWVLLSKWNIRKNASKSDPYRNTLWRYVDNKELMALL